MLNGDAGSRGGIAPPPATEFAEQIAFPPGRWSG